ncbi:MAG: hypothetical protein D3908_00145 [Candidatus Electrothrix sp. AUS4]|nr:hypothetical protein [Candidatus Electrothrix sp. AUS4]
MKIAKEDDNLLELEGKNSGGILLFLFIFIIILIYLAASPAENTCDKELASGNDLFVNLFIIIAVFSCFIFSIIDIFIKGYIRINKKKKEVHYFVGWRKFFSSPLVIPFAQIRCLKIETHKGSKAPPCNVILLQRINKKDITISSTYSDIYANEISSKIARYIGCNVYCES